MHHLCDRAGDALTIQLLRLTLNRSDAPPLRWAAIVSIKLVMFEPD